jgi:predicted dienelactone hydrolase
MVSAAGSGDADQVIAGYDPFAPGPLSVQTHTFTGHDDNRNRDFACTVWSSPDAPTDAALVLYSHHSFGDRNAATYLCTHLASHGFVVAALDHSERTAPQTAGADESAEQRAARVARVIADRVPDLRVLLDGMLDHRDDVPPAVGVVGHSFGGWTALSAADVDARIESIVAITPGGSASPRPGVLDAPLYPQRSLPTLFIAAEFDVPIPPDDVRDVAARTPGAALLVTVRDADHFHFIDDAETVHEQMRTTPIDGPAAWMPAAMKPFSELCTAESVHDLTRALALAHFDATLRGDDRAAQFVTGDLASAVITRGVTVDVEHYPH